MSPLKIVVTGPVCAGKTTFVRSLAQGTPLTTEQAVSGAAGKPKTTIGLDFARTHVGERPVKLFGTPGQDRFDYMRREIAQGADGYVLLIPMDRTSSLRKGLLLLHRMTAGSLPPVVVGLTRTDLVEERPSLEIDGLSSIAVGVDEIDARDSEQCRRLLLALTNEL